MHYKVEFVPNTKDGLHCLQSAYMMIFKFFKPDFQIDWHEFSRLTGFEKHKGTWALAGLLWFKGQGFDVEHITLFNYRRFVESGGDYMVEMAGPEVGNWMIEHSNIESEQNKAKQLLRSKVIKKREPTIQDIKSYLDKGYLLRCLVNAHALDNQSGYFGHAVVVVGYDDKNLYLHDPGPPPVANRRVSYAEFERAWADPSAESKELDAIRLTVK